MEENAEKVYPPIQQPLVTPIQNAPFKKENNSNTEKGLFDEGFVKGTLSSLDLLYRVTKQLVLESIGKVNLLFFCIEPQRDEYFIL